jgi:hypothetical protein
MNAPEQAPEDRPWAVTPKSLREERLGNPPPEFAPLEFRLRHGAQQVSFQLREFGFEFLEGIIEGRHEQLFHCS